MSILGTIMSTILGGRVQPAPPPAAMAASQEGGMAPIVAPKPPHAQAPPTGSEEPRTTAPTVAPTPPHAKAQADAPTPPAQPEAPKPQPQPAAHAKTPPSPATSHQVDVAAVLDKRAEEIDEQLDWRTSIVDLMKLLKLDSSLTARKALAKELNYTGATQDSAAMNVWLHRQVMAKLVQGGGKLPADVKH
jgi:hypothetical protein